jgi:SAM-dependent methyltransferase
MGDSNQYEFVRRHRAALAGPILETGARDYGSGQDYRMLFAGERYVTTDMLADENVSVVADLTVPFAEVDSTFKGERFGTIICMSVLEHCVQPFAMADNLVRLLKPGGRVIVSVPFAWCFHGYPSDYWRFTHEGIRALFPRLRFDGEMSCASTSHPGEFIPLDEFVGRVDILRRGGWMTRLVRRAIASAVRMAGVKSHDPQLARFPYVMAPTMINMIGAIPETG